MNVGFWGWAAFNGFILAMLALDLGVFNRHAHVIRAREALVWTAVWIALSLVFGAWLWMHAGPQSAVEYLTGYLAEKVLSMDNIFVMVMIFGFFGVPPREQHRVLYWGILGALVLRGAFIGAGALVLERWHWVLYVFGVLLVITGLRAAFRKDEAPDLDRNPVVRAARKTLRITHGYRGHRFVVREYGHLYATPLLVVLVTIEATDVLFAMDSIPAVFAITQDPFLVYTSNIFAILGLRSMYFVLADFVTRFVYLKYALSAILVFIGAKLLLAPVFELPPLTSLALILASVSVAIAASIRNPRRQSEPDATPVSPPA
ncbi:MAG: TerC family protein [Gemmatimonadetes bacterium]|nr:TerC family protein [Gemmatimonadota bacterium]